MFVCSCFIDLCSRGEREVSSVFFVTRFLLTQLFLFNCFTVYILLVFCLFYVSMLLSLRFLTLSGAPLTLLLVMVLAALVLSLLFLVLLLIWGMQVVPIRLPFVELVVFSTIILIPLARSFCRGTLQLQLDCRK